MIHCSPATVSRGGVIYVNAEDVGWKPVVDSWIEKLEAAEYRPLLTTLFSRYVRGAAVCASATVCASAPAKAAACPPADGLRVAQAVLCSCARDRLLLLLQSHAQTRT